MAIVISMTIGKNSFIAPIKGLVNTTRNFVLGNLDARIGLTDKPDELVTLAEAFDDMAGT